DFKGVNDSTEYAFGDEVLRSIGIVLKQNVRGTDFAARLGGDEFCVLLPQTPLAEAKRTAERIREHIANTVVHNDAYERRVTVSIGVDGHDWRTPGSLADLLHRVNKALHHAKRRGKNQVGAHRGLLGAPLIAARGGADGQSKPL